MSQKNYLPEVFWPLSKRMRVFKQNFTRLLYVHIYDKLQNFIQLSLNLTKVCHIKCITKWSFTFHYCTDFIAKDEWPPNSPDLNPLDYHVRGVVLQVVHGFHPKPKTIPELKSALQQICDDLPRTVINKAINDFHKLQTHARRPVVDILNIRQELYTEIVWLNSVCCFRRNLINCIF